MNDLKPLIQNYFDSNYRYTKNRNSIIIQDKDKSYVFKKSTQPNIKEIFKYLKSRDFHYMPEIIDENRGYYVSEYVEDIPIPNEQKALDLMYLLSLLHNKTTYFVSLDIDECKEIYESTIQQIEDVASHYTYIINRIEDNLDMSPSEYMLARNSSKIFQSLGYARQEIDRWFDLVKEKRKKRMVFNHNQLNVDHLLQNNQMYLISWDRSSFGSPIMDFYRFYRKNYHIYDFNNLFRVYDSKYPLLEDEKTLLFALLSIPDKIQFQDNEFANTRNITKIIHYIQLTEELITPYDHINHKKEQEE